MSGWPTIEKLSACRHAACGKLSLPAESFVADPGSGALQDTNAPLPVVQSLAILLLMAVFAQALFTLVRCNFVAFTFFSARHIASGI
jgi:hypothetical protein